MCAAETLDTPGKDGLEEIGKKGRTKYAEEYFGSKDEDGKTNIELYQKAEGVVEHVKKRRIQLYGHLLKMNRNRLIKNMKSSSAGRRRDSE